MTIRPSRETAANLCGAASQDIPSEGELEADEEDVSVEAGCGCPLDTAPQLARSTAASDVSPLLAAWAATAKVLTAIEKFGY
jgi:hypothetical protein